MRVMIFMPVMLTRVAMRRALDSTSHSSAQMSAMHEMMTRR